MLILASLKHPVTFVPLLKPNPGDATVIAGLGVGLEGTGMSLGLERARLDYYTGKA